MCSSIYLLKREKRLEEVEGVSITKLISTAIFSLPAGISVGTGLVMVVK